MTTQLTRRQLERAYTRTTYTARLPRRTLKLRVGQVEPLLDALLVGETRSWAYLTAWNPRSGRLSRAKNNQRQVALEAALRSLGYVIYPGWGIGEDPKWKERSCLVIGIELALAVDLGRVFEQNAILFGTRGKAARLVWP